MKPLPFVWPHALLFWAVELWAFWPEFGIIRRARRSAGAKDAKSLQVILLGTWIAFIGAFSLAWVPALQFRDHRVGLFLVGVAVMITGSLLRRHCWRMLGSAFTGDVRASADQEIITRGAYAILRHPSYTAGILVNTGVGIALGSWASAAIMAVVTFAVYLYRIIVEERALLAAIGEPYRQSSGIPVTSTFVRLPSGAMLRLENRHTGEILELRRRKQHGEVILELRGTLPAHQEGPPLHIHHVEDEEGVVTAGTLSVEVGGQRIDAGPGLTVRLPRGVPHRWWNQGEQPLAFEGRTRPAVDLDRYLQAVFEVMNAGAPNRPPLVYLAHVALRHRRTQTVLIMAPLIQAILFRATIVLGTLLGRYRGTDWPGCPARCTGAPEVAGENA